jgi:hypothetical protein
MTTRRHPLDAQGTRKYVHLFRSDKGSRHVLFGVVFLYFVGVSFWEYVLKK